MRALERERGRIGLPFIISSGRSEALHLQRKLTRDQLEQLSQDLVQRTVDICRQTLADADLSAKDVDEVLLVGGMTRMPLIQKAVAEFFGKEPSKGVHPDECVALGASIQAAALVDHREPMVLLDVTPHALGILTVGAVFEELIPQNTTVPTQRTKVFTTGRDNQTQVKIIVLQGGAEQGADNELLGEFLLTGLRRAPRGQVEIEVTFEINADGIVSVRADLRRGSSSRSGHRHERPHPRRDRQMVEAAKTTRRAALVRGVRAAKQEAETLVAASSSCRRSRRSSRPATSAWAIDKARGVVERGVCPSRKDSAPLKEAIDGLMRTHRMFRARRGQGLTARCLSARGNFARHPGRRRTHEEHRWPIPQVRWLAAVRRRRSPHGRAASILLERRRRSRLRGSAPSGGRSR